MLSDKHFLKKGISSLLLCFFFLSGQQFTMAQTWQPVGPNDNNWPSFNSAGFTSIAIDGSGTPYVVYSDGGNSGKATVKKFSAGSWTDVGTPGFSAGYAALYFDSFRWQRHTLCSIR